MDSPLHCVYCKEKLTVEDESYATGDNHWYKKCMQCDMCNVTIEELDKFIIVEYKLICRKDYQKFYLNDQDKLRDNTGSPNSQHEMQVNMQEEVPFQNSTFREQRKRQRR